jgi:hypothetical protein
MCEITVFLNFILEYLIVLGQTPCHASSLGESIPVLMLSCAHWLLTCFRVCHRNVPFSTLGQFMTEM